MDVQVPSATRAGDEADDISHRVPTVHATVRVECQVCGRMIGKGPEGLGIRRHSGVHRREFEAAVGREPEDYAEVREVLGDRETEQARFSALDLR